MSDLSPKQKYAEALQALRRATGALVMEAAENLMEAEEAAAGSPLSGPLQEDLANERQRCANLYIELAKAGLV